jgi:hypothetical protein
MQDIYARNILIITVGLIDPAVNCVCISPIDVKLLDLGVTQLKLEKSEKWGIERVLE